MSDGGSFSLFTLVLEIGVDGRRAPFGTLGFVRKRVGIGGCDGAFYLGVLESVVCD